MCVSLTELAVLTNRKNKEILKKLVKILINPNVLAKFLKNN